MTENLLCATVSVRGVIRNADGQILVVQRSADKVWELPGGRLSRGESPQQGLHREIREETGLDIDIADIVKANSWVNTADKGRFAVHYYCETTDDSATLSDEHVDIEWIRPEQTEHILCEAQAEAVDNAVPECDSETTDGTSFAQD